MLLTAASTRLIYHRGIMLTNGKQNTKGPVLLTCDQGGLLERWSDIAQGADNGRQPFPLMHTAEAVQISTNLANDAEDPAVRADAKASLTQAAEAIRQRGEDITRRLTQREGEPH